MKKVIHMNIFILFILSQNYIISKLFLFKYIKYITKNLFTQCNMNKIYYRSKVYYIKLYNKINNTYTFIAFIE